MNIDDYYHLTNCPFGLDKNIHKYFNYYGGIFFEAGANDGIRQSNTYVLEKILNWTGILVEPSFCYSELVNNRQMSICFNCALVSEDWNRETIKGTLLNKDIHSGNLMSMTEQSVIYNNNKNIIDVQAKTMNDVISSTDFKMFDLISLDTEGSEYSILLGFDFNKYKTKYFLIEILDGNINNYNNIFNLLMKNGYELEKKFEGGDYLFKNKFLL